VDNYRDSILLKNLDFSAQKCYTEGDHMRLAIVRSRIEKKTEERNTIRVLRFFYEHGLLSSLPQAREGSEWAKKLRTGAEGHLVSERFGLPLLLVLDDDGSVVWACCKPGWKQLRQALRMIKQ